MPGRKRGLRGDPMRPCPSPFSSKIHLQPAHTRHDKVCLCVGVLGASEFENAAYARVDKTGHDASAAAAPLAIQH